MDKKDEGVLEAVRPVKSFTLKELLEMLHDMEHAEDKILGADPNSEKWWKSSPRHRKDAQPILSALFQLLF